MIFSTHYQVNFTPTVRRLFRKLKRFKSEEQIIHYKIHLAKKFGVTSTSVYVDITRMNIEQVNHSINNKAL